VLQRPVESAMKLNETGIGQSRIRSRGDHGQDRSGDALGDIKLKIEKALR
jgi:hypothetical protein